MLARGLTSVVLALVVGGCTTVQPTTAPSSTETPAVTAAPSPAPAIAVLGQVSGGGLAGVGKVMLVQFAQAGRVVAASSTLAGSFYVRVPPGTYDVTVSNMPGGCPTTRVTIQSPGATLKIVCNLIS